MVVMHHVEGYDKFCEFIDHFDSHGQLVHIYFTGSKLPNGQSWCGDCVRAYPVVEKALATADPNSHFVCVEVGDKQTWKDKNCPFRKDTRLNLMVIPTLVRWNHPQKLSGSQLEKQELVEMLFSDE